MNAALLLLLAIAGCAMQNAAPPASKESSAMPTSLAPCPSSPNCVSSEATDQAHRIAPLPFSGDPSAAMARLRAVIEAMPRARVVSANDRALHAEFTSFLFRFVDDVDCIADPAAGVIQIRSASRTGYGDFGVNRKRVEQIRAAFEAPNP